MKIFLSYGHDSNAPLIEKIKEYLSRDAEGNLKHEVWIDTSEITPPSREQCVVSHIKRNASREMPIRLKNSGFKTDSKINKIGYLDPFESFFLKLLESKNYLIIHF